MHHLLKLCNQVERKGSHRSRSWSGVDHRPCQADPETKVSVGFQGLADDPVEALQEQKRVRF